MELFVDLNCPFCFWQVERVLKLELSDGVRWCGFEHTPALRVPPDRRHADALAIDSEIKMLKQREPLSAVIDPGFRPNTRAATVALAAVGRLHPRQHWTTIRAMGRALWLDGRDISDESVIAEVLSAASFGTILPTNEDEALVDGNSEAWESGPFERRLPAARSRHGAVLLGLNDERRFSLFARSGIFTVRGGDSC